MGAFSLKDQIRIILSGYVMMFIFGVTFISLGYVPVSLFALDSAPLSIKCRASLTEVTFDVM
jgi:hypothetical protein